MMESTAQMAQNVELSPIPKTFMHTTAVRNSAAMTSRNLVKHPASPLPNVSFAISPEICAKLQKISEITPVWSKYL